MNLKAHKTTYVVIYIRTADQWLTGMKGWVGEEFGKEYNVIGDGMLTRTDFPKNQSINCSQGAPVHHQAPRASLASPLNSAPPHYCQGFLPGGPQSDPFCRGQNSEKYLGTFLSQLSSAWGALCLGVQEDFPGITRRKLFYKGINAQILNSHISSFLKAICLGMCLQCNTPPHLFSNMSFPIL